MQVGIRPPAYNFLSPYFLICLILTVLVSFISQPILVCILTYFCDTGYSTEIVQDLILSGILH